MHEIRILRPMIRWHSLFVSLPITRLRHGKKQLNRSRSCLGGEQRGEGEGFDAAVVKSLWPVVPDTSLNNAGDAEV